MKKYILATITYQEAVGATLKALAVGPAVILLAILTGADPMDGFAGSGYGNTGWQDIILKIGTYIYIVIAALSFVTTLVLAARRFRQDKAFLTIPLLPLGSVPVVIYALFMGSIVADVLHALYGYII